MAYFEEALGALRHEPETRETIELAIDLRFDLRSCLFATGAVGPIVDQMRDAEALAEGLGDRRRLARILGHMANALSVGGDNERAIEAGERALAIGAELGDVGLQVVTSVHLGQIYYTTGNYSRAIDGLRRNVASLEDQPVHQRFGMAGYPSVVSLGFLAACLAEVGDFAEGMAAGNEALRIAEGLKQPYSLALASCYAGTLYLRRGRLREAVTVLERGLGLCHAWDLPGLLPQGATALGSAYALSGRPAESLPLLEQALEQAASKGFVTRLSAVAAALSEAYLLAGRLDNAMSLAERAYELSVAHTGRGPRGWAHRLLGEMAVRREPPDLQGAETNYRQALALAEELGMRPLQAHCHLGLGVSEDRAAGGGAA
ncbi:MAG TPA: tetratricopeptide repeat protein [Chloroflexota bacterium]|nr:tetratricopeptide repeat protein [Chloroflexota bacterium]